MRQGVIFLILFSLFSSAWAGSVVSKSSPIILLPPLTDEMEHYIGLGGHFFVRAGSKLIDVGEALQTVGDLDRYSVTLTEQKLAEVLAASPDGRLDVMGPPPLKYKTVKIMFTEDELKERKEEAEKAEIELLQKIKAARKAERRAKMDRMKQSLKNLKERALAKLEGRRYRPTGGAFDYYPEHADRYVRQLERVREEKEKRFVTESVLDFPQAYKKTELIPIDRVFGAPPDPECKTPILISDVHGILVGWGPNEDKCLATEMKQFQEKYNLNIVLVSSGGDHVAEEIKQARIADDSKVVALENEPDQQMGTAKEKAARIKRRLVDTGACILGFSSEDHGREGAVCQELGIPYFGVYQREKNGALRYGVKLAEYPKGTRFTRSWCEMIPEMEKQLLERRGRPASEAVFKVPVEPSPKPSPQAKPVFPGYYPGPVDRSNQSGGIR